MDHGKGSEVWDVDTVSGLVTRSSEAATLVGLWHAASTPAEWERQGDYLAERGYHAAALECFRSAGHADKTELAQAHVHAADGRHAEAAPLFERRGMHALAATSWEKAGAWERASVDWRHAGDPDRADLDTIRGFEARGNWREAAQGWERRGSTDPAAAAWEKAGDFEHLAGLWLAQGKLQKAAGAFDRAKLPLRAAECLEKLGRSAEAADRYFRAGEHARAASLYAKAGNYERLAACLFKMEEWRWLADLHERRGETAEAVAMLKRWLEGGAGRRRALEKELAALPAALPAAADSRHAAILRAALGGSAESLALAGRFLDAALAVEASALPDDERWNKAFEHLGRYLASPAGETLAARDALHDAAEAMLAGGRTREALARFRVLGDTEGECAAYLALDRDEEAIARFLETGAIGAVRRMMHERQLRLSAAFLRELVDTFASGGVFATEDGQELARLGADLLEHALPGLAKADAADLERRFDAVAHPPPSPGKSRRRRRARGAAGPLP
jgi:tetratricopeptide (TPR) repeat protein